MAIFINPTVYDNVTKKIICADHNIDFHHMINHKFKVIARYHCWARYKPKHHVEELAKEEKACLIAYKHISNSFASERKHYSKSHETKKCSATS